MIVWAIESLFTVFVASLLLWADIRLCRDYVVQKSRQHLAISSQACIFELSVDSRSQSQNVDAVANVGSKILGVNQILNCDP